MRSRKSNVSTRNPLNKYIVSKKPKTDMLDGKNYYSKPKFLKNLNNKRIIKVKETKKS